ncbi:MAG TPA: hypothetical protein VOA00_07365 [Thermoanaerobaculia bacterium]|nr:hypothetical protein [Thermoanaerobaculia bacterium]
MTIDRSRSHGTDPDQPVDHFRTLEQARSNDLASPRLTATLLGLFALLAMAITATGMRQEMTLVGIGLAIGLAAALLFARLLSGLLFGVGPTDPLTFAAVAVVLSAVAAAACFLPARRATAADPMHALRSS